MKTKKNKKELVLNKVTISQLDNDTMNQVKSGDLYDPNHTEISVGNSGCAIFILQ